MEDPTELLDSKAELDQEEMERLLRENRALKGRLDELERENRLLKQRNFDLSMRYGRSAENRRQPFELVFSDSDGGDDGDGNDGGSLSNGTDNNDVSGAGYSIEESESGIDVNSGNESAEGAADQSDVSKTRWGDASKRRASKSPVMSKELGGRDDKAGRGIAIAGIPAQSAGPPSNAARVREKQRHALDLSDADREGSARHADAESAPAKEKRPV
ncbi:hypothetical protein GGI20_004914, partial [Coemansia sp. BCRC 34301]